MRAPFLLVASLLVPLAAGCLQTQEVAQDGLTAPLSLSEIEDRLSAPVYTATERLETTLDSNGTRIWLDVFRPAGATEQLPVILQMTPYRTLADASRNCQETDRETCPWNPDLVAYFVPRGYAVAFADIRGNHNSAGCNDNVGLASRQDGYNVVEWLGTQTWSNGRVGMFGASFDGEIQIATATLAPPHLTTIVPIAAPTSGYKNFFYDGVPFALAGITSTTAYTAIGAAPGNDPASLPSYPDRIACQQANYQAGLDKSGDWGPFWEERDHSARVAAIRASVLQSQGLVDGTVGSENLDGFWNNLTSEKRLILGQWDHEFPRRPDWALVLHRWFDHWLKGIDTGILRDLPPVLTQDGAGDWRGIDAFPPVQNETVTFHLGSDGTLTASTAEDGTLVLQDYPRGSNEAPVASVVEIPGQTATGRPGVLVFESAPLEEDLHYTGRPFVHLVASTDAKSTHWVVRFMEVDPEEDPVLQEGAPGDEQEINRGFVDSRHRFGVKNPEDLSPGEVYEAVVRMYPQDDVIEKGHGIRIEISNNDNHVEQDTTFATSTVYFGPEGTRLVLPLAPVGRPIPEDALRDDLRAESGG